MAEYFWDRTLTKCLCFLFVNEVARRQPYTNCTWPRFINVKSSCDHIFMCLLTCIAQCSTCSPNFPWVKCLHENILVMKFCHAVENRILPHVKWSSSTVRWREPFFILCVIGGGVSRTVHTVMDSLLHFQVVRPIHYVPTDFHWAIGIILTCTTCTRFWFNSVYFFFRHCEHLSVFFKYCLLCRNGCLCKIEMCLYLLVRLIKGMPVFNKWSDLDWDELWVMGCLGSVWFYCVFQDVTWGSYKTVVTIKFIHRLTQQQTDTSTTVTPFMQTFISCIYTFFSLLYNSRGKKTIGVHS